jgi:hypothetical protein
VERQKDGTLTFERAIAAGEEQLYLPIAHLNLLWILQLHINTGKLKQDVVYPNPRLPLTPTVAGIRPEEIPSNLPRSGVIQFVGRDEALKTLHEQLQQKERVAICAIAGMGGVGKTELALQYARLISSRDLPWRVVLVAGGGSGCRNSNYQLCQGSVRFTDTRWVGFARTGGLLLAALARG